MTTVGRWLKYLGYTYDRVKKKFYVDGHERPERKKFCKKYLQELEPQCTRWVQLPEDELDGLPELIPSQATKIKNRGCYYWRRNVDNKKMLEFHEDDIDDIEELSNKHRKSVSEHQQREEAHSVRPR